jgi:hypothetical protein
LFSCVFSIFWIYIKTFKPLCYKIYKKTKE